MIALILWYEISNSQNRQQKNLIIQFPIFIQPYTQQPLILYQLETVPVPIADKILKQILTLNSGSKNHI